MEKKYYIHSLSTGLFFGVGVLYFGFIIASSSRIMPLVQDEAICGNNESYQSYETKEEREQRVKTLESTIRVMLKTAGRSGAALIYPALGTFLQKRALNSLKRKTQKRSVAKKKKLSKTRIRSLSAQKKWMRAQNEPIFKWPLKQNSFRISSKYGPRTIRGKTGFHKGIDMAAVKGTPVSAALAGKVIEAQYLPGYGNTILLSHSKRFRTRYAHLHKLLVEVGQAVTSGQLIGTVGSTGHVLKSKFGSSGSHLHFEVYSHGRAVNPFNFLA